MYISFSNNEKIICKTEYVSTTFNNVANKEKKYKLPPYSHKLKLSSLDMQTCHGEGIFGNCYADCGNHICECHTQLFTCVCSCLIGSKMVSVDENQYHNYEKLVEILNKHSDEKTDVVFKEILTMIDSLEKQDYETFNLNALKLENDLTKLNVVQKRNVNKFFASLGISRKI